jgi:hypothetical protein
MTFGTTTTTLGFRQKQAKRKLKNNKETIMPDLIFCHAYVEYFYMPNRGPAKPEPLVGRVTFAAQPVKAGEVATYSAAWVAPMDTFDRKAGRKIAERRLKGLCSDAQSARPVKVFNDSYEDFWNSIFADAISNGPSRWIILNISTGSTFKKRL